MTQYRVRWEIDVNAESPLEAARLARYYQTKPDTTATVFHIASWAPDGHYPASAFTDEVDLGGPGEPGHINDQPLPEPYCNHDHPARTPMLLDGYEQCECGVLLYNGTVVTDRSGLLRAT